VRILVVEDDDLTRSLVTRYVGNRLGHEVVEARHGREALQAIELRTPDVVLLDLLMPVMDGADVLRHLRADPRYAHLPVIIMTAAAERDTARALIRLGVTDFMVKPLTAETAKRLATTLAGLQHGRPSAASRAPGARRRVLLVDGDTPFRVVARQALGEDMEVLEAETGVEGFRLFLDVRPEIVCLGEGLSLLQERRLAERIRDAHPDSPTRVYLCAWRGTAADSALYTDVIPKSLDAAAFRRDFDRIVLKSPS
jgi:CheY-like chemotaxis protein